MADLGTSGNPFSKDPSAVKDYIVNWVAWLAGDTITTSTWAVSPSGLTALSPTNTTTTATVWLSGGTDRVLYQVTNRIVTVGGRTEEHSIYVYVREQ